eukprot:scaffold341_cov235-Chaetoceros_neogracile.AAC.6
MAVETTIITPPSPMDKAATARWLTHNTGWGSISTIDSRERPGSPFGNIASFSDGAPDQSTANVYFLHSSLDSSIIDVMKNNLISFAISEMQTGYCDQKGYDAEGPRCARLSMSGRLIKVVAKEEIETAKHALFSKHPSMKEWYSDDDMGHDFNFWKLELGEIWLVDFFGGAALIDLESWKRGTDKEGPLVAPRGVQIKGGIDKTDGMANRSASGTFFLLGVGLVARFVPLPSVLSLAVGLHRRQANHLKSFQ